MNKDIFKETRKCVRRLHQAITAENLQEVDKLLKESFDIDYMYSGKTASELAFQTRNLQICSKVFAKGCDLNKRIDCDGNTLLFKAICDGIDDEMVKILLENGADPDFANDCDLTPIHYAASYGHFRAAKILIDRSTFINRCDTTGQTALFKCSSNGHVAIVKLFIEAGTDIEWADNERKTALVRAVESNHVHVVKTLIEAGSHINVRDQYGRTPLLFSAKYGFLDIAKFLIANGAEIEKCDSQGSTPFSEAIINLNLDMVEELMKSGCNINSNNFDLRQTALHRCIYQASKIYGQRDKQLKLFNMLMSSKCNVNIADHHGCVPLHHAAMRGESELAKALIEKGAIVHQTNNSGETLLHASVVGNQLELVEIFVKAGTSVNCVNNQNETPLYVGVFYKSNISILEKLIEYGSDLNICEKSSHTTPLYAGVLKDYKEAVALLIKAGSDVNIMNRSGTTPLWAACDSKNDKIVKYLLQARHVCVDMGFSFSPMHAAVKNGCMEIARMLVDAKCDVNKLTDFCKSPLHIASETNSLEMAVLLIKSGADSAAHRDMKKRDRCCLIYHDPHPHLELEPLMGALENNNLKMMKLLTIASHKIHHEMLTTLKDIMFRTSYARDARLTETILVQYARFFALVLTVPRTLKEMTRGIVRKRLGLYPATKIDGLNLPDRLKHYVLLSGLEAFCSNTKDV